MTLNKYDDEIYIIAKGIIDYFTYCNNSPQSIEEYFDKNKGKKDTDLAGKIQQDFNNGELPDELNGWVEVSLYAIEKHKQRYGRPNYDEANGVWEDISHLGEMRKEVDAIYRKYKA